MRRQSAGWIALAVACVAAPIGSAEELLLMRPHKGIEIVDTARFAKSFAAKQGTLTDTVTSGGLTFNIEYGDATGGFADPALGPDRRARVRDALTYIGLVIGEPGTLDVFIEPSENDGSGFLAAAGTFFTNAPGFQQGTTLTRLETGVKPFPGTPEIQVIVDFGFSWNVTTAPPSPGQLDLLSILTHEFTHGLGFASLSNAVGNSNFGLGAYSAYDSFLGRGTDEAFLFDGTPLSLDVPVATLTSNNVVFLGAEARAAFSAPPPIQSPFPFDQGSSLSHVRDGIAGGAVMDPTFAFGEEIRRYRAVDLGIIRDIGYANAMQAATCPLTGVAILSPPATITPSGLQTQVTFTSDVDFNTSGGCFVEAVRVSYVLNGAQNIGFSCEASANFPVTATLTPGTYSLVATALIESTGQTETATRTFTIEQPAIGTLELTPNGPVDFGMVPVGEQALVDVVVRNTGVGTLDGRVSLAGSGFSLATSGAYTLPPGSARTVTLRFAPTRAGNATGTAEFSGGINGPITLSLNGFALKVGLFGFGCGPGSGSSGGFGGDLALVAAVVGLLALGGIRRRTA